MSAIDARLGDWDEESYERILVQYINSMLTNSSALAQKKSFTAKDLYTLTPSQFKEIVGFIFQQKMPPKLQEALEGKDSVVKKLDNFNNLYKEFNCSYDSQPMKFYHALKSLFPSTSELDLLRPSVVLNPSGDQLRTRKVLRYLTGLMLYNEELAEHFEEVYEGNMKEINDRIALRKQLDDIKSDINKKLVQHDDWKVEVVNLKREKQNKRKEVEQLEKDVTEYEERVKAASHVYKKLEHEKNLLTRELDDINRQVELNSKLLVTSADTILAELEAAKLQLESLNQLRSNYGKRLDDCSRETALVEEVTEEAGRTRCFLNDLVELMQNAIYAKNSSSEPRASIAEKVKLIEDLKLKIQNLGMVPANSNEQLQERMLALETLCRQLEEVENSVNDLQALVQQVKYQKDVLTHKVLQLQRRAEEIKNVVQVSEDYILLELPQQRAEMGNLVATTLDLLKNEFSSI